MDFCEIFCENTKIFVVNLIDISVISNLSENHWCLIIANSWDNLQMHHIDGCAVDRSQIYEKIKCSNPYFIFLLAY